MALVGYKDQPSGELGNPNQPSYRGLHAQLPRGFFVGNLQAFIRFGVLLRARRMAGYPSNPVDLASALPVARRAAPGLFC
jgi:hypothetical protein